MHETKRTPTPVLATSTISTICNTFPSSFTLLMEHQSLNRESPSSIRYSHQVTHQVWLHLVNDSSQGRSSPLSSVTDLSGHEAIRLEDQLLVHEEVHLPSSPSLHLVLLFFSTVTFIMWTFSANKHMDGWTLL